MLGIIVFVFMMAGLLTMVTVNAGITPAGTVTLNATGPSVITGNNLVSTTGSNITSCNQSFGGKTIDLIAGILVFLPQSWVNAIENSVAGCTNTVNGNGLTASLGQFTAVGSVVTGSTLKSQVSPLVDTTIGIAVVFIGIGLLAGLFGAGILAGVISGVGIVLSMVYYFIGVINAPNPYNPSTTYFAMPPIFEGVFLGFIASIMIYMLLSTISKSA
jgi:hypothetical protein